MSSCIILYSKHKAIFCAVKTFSDKSQFFTGFCGSTCISFPNLFRRFTESAQNLFRHFTGSAQNLAVFGAFSRKNGHEKSGGHDFRQSPAMTVIFPTYFVEKAKMQCEE